MPISLSLSKPFKKLDRGEVDVGCQSPQEIKPTFGGVPLVSSIDNGRVSNDSLIVEVSVQNTVTYALVDLGAQVTVLSREFVSKLALPPKAIGEAKLRGAEAESIMDANKLSTIVIGLGSQTFEWDGAYMASISDCVILGLDFLRAVGAKIDLGRARLEMGEEEIIARYGRLQAGGEYHISQVVCSGKTVVPPESVCYLPVSVQIADGDCVCFSPSLCVPNLLLPHALISNNSVLQVINLGENNLTIQKGEILGVSTGFDELSSDLGTGQCYSNDYPLLASLCAKESSLEFISEDQTKAFSLNVVEHLQDLFIRSCKYLSVGQSLELVNLLNSYDRKSYQYSNADKGASSKKRKMERSDPERDLSNLKLNTQLDRGKRKQSEEQKNWKKRCKQHQD